MSQSVVEYLAGHDGYRCGYCGTDDACYSHGMWAHKLSTVDYQYLIDRGWRRSGKYCYKPTMHVTCCPLYTIRCEALKCSLTRSQKKVLKKVNKFLAIGEHKKTLERCSQDPDCEEEMDVSGCPQEADIQALKRIKEVKHLNTTDIQINDKESSSRLPCGEILPNETRGSPSSDLPKTSSLLSASASNPTSPIHTNILNTRPQCRKAKEIRKERKLQKLLKMGVTVEEAQSSLKKKGNEPKSLEDFLYDSLPPHPAHKLEFRFVLADIESEEFLSTFEESHRLYTKYQTAIHHEKEEECTKSNFEDFLIESPFNEGKTGNLSSGNISFGSYHQQYWLDNKLIAVAVIDILPYCVSSVYFYYDPDYSFLSLGTYAALREIALVRELNKKLPDLQYYYMGFYIHSCVKMRYKGQFVPSFLLCPETYIFQPIERCRPKLNKSKYSRLEEDPLKDDTNGVTDMKDVLILYDRTRVTYSTYRKYKKDATDEEEVREYASFVGRKCYERMLLYRER